MAFPLEGQHCGEEHFTHWKRVVAKGSRLRKRLNVTTLCCTDAGGRDRAAVKKRPTRNRATVVFPKLPHVMALVENAIHAWHMGKATGQHFWQSWGSRGTMCPTHQAAVLKPKLVTSR